MAAVLSDIAAGLKARLAATGQTQAWLAAQAGVSAVTMGKVLAGHDYRVSTLLSIAERLGLEVALVPRSLAHAIQAGPAATATATAAAAAAAGPQASSSGAAYRYPVQDSAAGGGDARTLVGEAMAWLDLPEPKAGRKAP